jgi:hypothetical protein
MSIRRIAQELYRSQQEVERLAQRLSEAPPALRADLETALMRARIEKDRLRRVLDGGIERKSQRGLKI